MDMKLEDLDSDMIDTFFKVAKFYFLAYGKKPYLTKADIVIATVSIRRHEVRYPFYNAYHRDTVITAMEKTGLIVSKSGQWNCYSLTDFGHEVFSVLLL